VIVAAVMVVVKDDWLKKIKNGNRVLQSKFKGLVGEGRKVAMMVMVAGVV
jgi:hypothetical protein